MAAELGLEFLSAYFEWVLVWQAWGELWVTEVLELLEAFFEVLGSLA